MAYTAARTWIAGEIPTSAIMNVHIRDNFSATAVAIVTTAGDTVHATADKVLTRLPIGVAKSVYTTNSGATAPQWTGPFVAAVPWSLL